MADAYFTIEKQEHGIINQVPGYYAIWYNNGSGTSASIAENIGSKKHAETMAAALDANTIE
jgi:hypothetical protein